MTRLRVGTRGSRLALAQTRWACDRLRRAHPDLQVEEVIVTTHGDEAKDRPFDASWPAGGFVGALEEALLRGEVDFAVHSHKDLPSASPDGLAIAAVPQREAAHDVLITREPVDLERLPDGFTVGTSSPRRIAQLRRLLGVRTTPIRGNVPSRLEKLQREPLDAIALAAAGLRRLGIELGRETILPPQRFVPAPAQGALAIQARKDDPIVDALSALDDAPSRRAVEAERAFLARVAAGCQTPLGAWAVAEGDRVALRAQLFGDDGSRLAEGVAEGERAADVGARLADRLMNELRAPR
jgi:hydroxymethylbilane synthase